MRARETRRRLAWALLAFVAFGCRQIAGMGDRVESDCGAFSFAVPACGTCMQDHCCEAMTACSENTSCKSALACLARCALDDAACRLACEARAPGNELKAVLDCRDASCAATFIDTGNQLTGWTKGGWRVYRRGHLGKPSMIGHNGDDGQSHADMALRNDGTAVTITLNGGPCSIGDPAAVLDKIFYLIDHSSLTNSSLDLFHDVDASWP